ncbi:alpha-glucosidase [Bacillus gobiensis]|uniref:glycoside hydrolase family 13 protein n=1 Tax=Bacillus gobiensis TaxID=1441095 RepID=UPI003D22C9F4
MQSKKWWQNSVIYQIYPKSFKDTNHDGIGDINGVIEKLDYLKELGIDVIWLNPVFCSPMDDNGYDISDYMDIAPEYGTMNDMDRLIAEAKKREISIIMDLVLNHTSDEHPWFIESRKSKDNKKRDWYIWRDPKIDGSAPNNWRSKFGGSAWEYDERSGQYYLHVFSKKQPDLNWDNPEVREALYEMIHFWLKKGIAGFRLDAITFIKKSDMMDDFPSDSSDGLSPVDIGTLNQPGLLEHLHELKKKAFNQDIFTVAEAPGVLARDLPDYVGDNGVFDMLFEFGHVDIDLDKDGKWYKPLDRPLSGLKKVISESQEVINQIGWSPLYIENHDLPRSINHFLGQHVDGPIPAKLLATFYMLLKGTPFIYQGQELGMTNVNFPSIEYYNDIASIGQYKQAVEEGYSEEEALKTIWRRSRDNGRTPMHWDNSNNAGFSEHEPWLSINPNYQTINVQNNLTDSNSVFHYYRQLIQLRKNNEVLLHGSYDNLMPDDKDLWTYTRSLGNEKIIVILNFSDKTVPLHLPSPININETPLLIGNYSAENNEPMETNLLRPFEARVYQLKSEN